MRIIFPALFCFLLCATNASAQSPVATASSEATSTAASGEIPLATATGELRAAASPPLIPLSPIRSKSPVAAARGKTIEMALGYSYVSQAENQSKRLGLRGADASFTIGFSRLGLKADVGYVHASNVLGTGQHSSTFSYLAGPVFHPTRHRSFDTYVHALVGGARVSGPILTNNGLILLGGWTTGYAWALGGGVEYWVTDAVAIRTGADYMRTAFYDSSLVVRGQGNLKTTASVVYYFGMRSRKRL
jgi:opacity protein-like surface antigen